MSEKPANAAKVCITCRNAKREEEFRVRTDTGKRRNTCNVCWDNRTAAWVKENKKRSNEIKNNWQKRNPENLIARKALYRKRNPIGYRKWNLENPELVKKINKAWAEKHRPERAFTAAKRRAAKLLATPIWADESEILRIYSLGAKTKKEVDHIVPLQHELVCGLHCEHNLQLLDISENRRKSNKLWPNMP